MIEISECHDQIVWDKRVRENGGHPLQLWGWGEVKAAHGWEVRRYTLRENQIAQVLIKTLPWPFRSLAYIPRGPVGKWSSDDFRLLTRHLKSRYHAICVTIEPDSEETPSLEGLKTATNSILLARTLILDLAKTETELLEAMSKKTRQYIRKSEREDIVIREVDTSKELEACLAIYHQTATRAGFALHGDKYYLDVRQKLGKVHAPIFVAYKDNQPLAFVWLAVSTRTSFELYGGMTDRGQELRANYILKWHAIREMKKRGVARYDLNGLLNDGISSFKKGFASHETMLAGTFDYPLSSLYGVWAWLLPMAKKSLQKIRSLRK